MCSWGPPCPVPLSPRAVMCRDCHEKAALSASIMEDAFRLREAVVSAVCSQEYTRLAGIIQQLAKLVPDEEMLSASGIGHLVADRHIWALAGHVVQRRAAALQASWRVRFRHARAAGNPPCKKKAPKPLAGYGAKSFLAHIHAFEREASKVACDSDKALHRAVAVKAVLLGFCRFEDLAGTHESDVVDMIKSPAARCLFMKLVAKASSSREAHLARMTAVAAAQASWSTSSSLSRPASSSTSCGPAMASACAEGFACTVKQLDPDLLQDSIAEVFRRWHVPVEKNTPTSTVAALSSACGQGEPVAAVLLAKAAAYRLDFKRLSRAPVASALRLWHSFAVNVLAYGEASTLPPRSGSDVEAFVGGFQKPRHSS